MYPETPAFREAVQADRRHIEIYLHIGSYIDNTSADDITDVVGDVLPMSNPLQMVDANYALTPGLATWEGGGIPTAVSNGWICPPYPGDGHRLETGIWSEPVSGDDGTIDWTLTVHFGGRHLSAITIYCHEVQITEADMTFLVDGQTEHAQQCDIGDGYIDVGHGYPYDELRLHVTKLADPYKHCRITELEFGSSITISRCEAEVQTDDDPTLVDIPLWELSFKTVDEYYEYTFDNFYGRAIDIGSPVELSYSVQTSDGGKSTICCGLYLVRDIQEHKGLISVTCRDVRTLLAEVTGAWSMTAGETVAEAIGRVLGMSGIECVTDPGVTATAKACAFGVEDDHLEQVRQVLQFYGLALRPMSDARVRLCPVTSHDAYGDISGGQMLGWPQMGTGTRSYNRVDVGYPGGIASVALTDPLPVAPIILSVSNPLVETQAEALALATRIKDQSAVKQVTVDWIGDPAVTAGDTIGFPGRYTEATARPILSQDLQYSGGLTAKTTVRL